MKTIIILSISIIALFLSCKCQKNTHYKKNFTLEQSAKLKFSDKYNIEFNKTKEYAIVSKSFKEITQSIPDLAFFIYSNKDRNIIFSDTLEAGDVYWLNDFEILTNTRTQKAESKRIQYIYNVKEKKIMKR